MHPFYQRISRSKVCLITVTLTVWVWRWCKAFVHFFFWVYKLSYHHSFYVLNLNSCWQFNMLVLPTGTTKSLWDNRYYNQHAFLPNLSLFPKGSQHLNHKIAVHFVVLAQQVHLESFVCGREGSQIFCLSAQRKTRKCYKHNIWVHWKLTICHWAKIVLLQWLKGTIVVCS